MALCKRKGKYTEPFCRLTAEVSGANRSNSSNAPLMKNKNQQKEKRNMRNKWIKFPYIVWRQVDIRQKLKETTSKAKDKTNCKVLFGQ